MQFAGHFRISSVCACCLIFRVCPAGKMDDSSQGDVTTFQRKRKREGEGVRRRSQMHPFGPPTTDPAAISSRRPKITDDTSAPARHTHTHTHSQQNFADNTAGALLAEKNISRHTSLFCHEQNKHRCTTFSFRNASSWCKKENWSQGNFVSRYLTHIKS
uniref:Putative secreted protein n=1 Tax=Ixodes ricinus TaxID=34613 RepID=A0A6B0UY78_IXORI